MIIESFTNKVPQIPSQGIQYLMPPAPLKPSSPPPLLSPRQTSAFDAPASAFNQKNHTHTHPKSRRIC